MRRVLPAALAFVVVVSGCATRGSVRKLTAEVAELRSQAAGLRLVQLGHAQELARLASDIRGLDARARDLGNGVSAAGDTARQLVERVTVVEGVVRNARTALLPRRVAGPPPPPAATPPPPPRAAAEGAYQTALATFRAHEHGQAVLEFLDFLAKHPNHPLAANAQYWIGEAYYTQRDYRQALVEFQKVFEHGAADGKAADALLKMGLCYQRLREPVRAEQAWQQVLKEYPGSDAAERARALLRRRASR
jgi:tol-pal system protein YbgF